MGNGNSNPVSPLTDTPWFWIYLFCTAGLVALAIIEPKYRARQAQLERQYQGRQRAWEQASGQQPTTPLSNPQHTLITLRPLTLTLALLLALAWLILWWTRYRWPRRRQAEPNSRGDVP